MIVHGFMDNVKKILTDAATPTLQSAAHDAYVTETKKMLLYGLAAVFGVFVLTHAAGRKKR